MTQPLTDQELEHLLHFVGYGTLDAGVWFLGMEEAGGGEANVHTRLQFRTVEDNAEAHKLLGITKHHWGRRTIQRTWRGMCYIMLRMEDREPTRENIRRYQAEALGRTHGQTLLTELMPIPKPNIGEWGYETLIPQFSSRQDYYDMVMPRRIRYLTALLTEHKPAVVIGYGKAYWPAYKKLFPNMSFTSASQFDVATTAGTVVVLTDHLTARTMNGKLDEVVAIIRRAQCPPN